MKEIGRTGLAGLGRVRVVWNRGLWEGKKKEVNVLRRAKRHIKGETQTGSNKWQISKDEQDYAEDLFTRDVMTAKRDLLLPLLLICLLKTISSLPMTSQSPEFDPLEAVTLLGSPTEGYVFVPEYFDDFDSTVTSSVPFIPTHSGDAFKRCDYKPCLENQPSCYELSASTGCLCPGFTLNNVLPESPSLKTVTLNGSEVIVEWCEPLSYVTDYVVTVGGQEKHTFSRDKRRGSIGQVDNVIQVCVSALNNAGESGASCTMYQPKDTSLPLKIGLVGGVLVLLAVLLMVVLVWRRRRQRKQEAHISSAL
ncbi:hypothetical protein WMY93_007823 [Mugilogobius chulae]|uniref:Fibronectin type-III domain-containing protein n=1 Tax=Mugilogobius chulae TaxID=88201 RepID=A0AAW0PMX5_9GOBI